MAGKDFKILGVTISSYGREKILGKISELISAPGKHLITTPNPEFLLTARKDDDFFHILNSASLAVPDGIGLKFAAYFKGVNLKRYPGADLTKDLLALAEKNAWPVAVINWHAGLSSGQQISVALKKLYPALHFLVKDERRGDYVFDLSDLRHFRPWLIFSSLGAPYQEKLLTKLLQRTSARVCLGVGGSFDFLTGQALRAPAVLRWLGLEWLWRLARAPRKRLKRIYNAVVIFPLIFLREEVLRRLFYRPNVVGFIFQGEEVLLVNALNHDQADHWKLPQGGVDPDENKEEALIREMTEELGTGDFEIVARFDNIYKYRWPREYRRGYKGQKQTLFILRFNGDKRSITLSPESKGFKWVPFAKFIDEAEPIRRASYALFLQKFKETVN